MSIELLIKEYLRYLLNNLGRSPLTTLNYQYNLLKFVKYVATSNIYKITLEMIIMYGQHLKRQRHNGHAYSPATVQSSMKSIKLFYAWLYDIKGIKTINPRMIPISYSRSIRVEYLTMDDFRRIIGCLNVRRFSDMRMRAMLEFYIASGARLSGILNLEIKDVDLDRMEAVIKKKGGGYMTVYFNERTKLWLRKYLERRTDDYPYLWITRNCKGVKKVSVDSLEQQVYRLRQKAKIGKHWTLHTLRHTFATRLLQNGANIRQVQELLGHSSLNSTMIYTNFTNSDLKNAHKKYLKI